MPAAGGNTISGKSAKVVFGANDFPEVTNWTIDPKVTVDKYASSGTGGWKTGREGVRDSSGTFTFKFDIDDPIHDHIDFTLALPSSPFSADAEFMLDETHGYGVPIIVTSLSFTNDPDDGTITGGTANWEGTGPISKIGF